MRLWPLEHFGVLHFNTPERRPRRGQISCTIFSDQIHIPTIGWGAGLLFLLAMIVLGTYWMYRKRAKKARKQLNKQKALTWEAAAFHQESCAKVTPFYTYIKSHNKQTLVGGQGGGLHMQEHQGRRGRGARSSARPLLGSLMLVTYADDCCLIYEVPKAN